MANDDSSWAGYAFPIVKGPKGYFAAQTGINQIKSDLLQLLLTYPGERVMLPGFGTPLKDLIFEPGDKALATRARQMIIDSIRQWEPRIAVDAITVNIGIDQSLLNPSDDRSELNSIMSIQIQFRDPSILTEAQELVLEVPLTGK